MVTGNATKADLEIADFRQVLGREHTCCHTESSGKITKGLINVVERLTAIKKQPALRITPAQHQAAIVSAAPELMSLAARWIDAAADALMREQQNLATLIGTARNRRTQGKQLA